MADADGWLLELRLFTVHPGTRPEFHRISQDGTIPLMRQLGITVLAHGPSLNNENGYYLLRAFPSEQERLTRSQSFYETPEWVEKYEESVSGMIAAYETAVLRAEPDVLRRFAAGPS